MKVFRRGAPPQVPEGRRSPAGRTNQATPQVFSYYAGRSNSRSNLGRSERLQSNGDTMAQDAGSIAGIGRQEVMMAALLGLFLLIAGYALNLSTEPRIIVVGGVTTASSGHTVADYRQATHTLLAGSLLNRNKLTIDNMRLTTDLKTHFPELRSVSLTVPVLSRQPVVRVEPFSPACVLQVASGSRYLLDTTGRVISTAVQPEQAVGLPTLALPLSHIFRTGGQAVPSTTLSFIKTVTTALQTAKVSYGTLTVPPASQELDVPLSGSSLFVKFNLQIEPEQQIGSFLAVSQRLAGQKITPSQYIDVRIEGRAYYK